jgi:hypothetical protein
VGAVALAVALVPVEAVVVFLPPGAGWGEVVGVPARVPVVGVAGFPAGVRQLLVPLHVCPAAHQVPLLQQTPSLAAQMPSLHSLGCVAGQ